MMHDSKRTIKVVIVYETKEATFKERIIPGRTCARILIKSFCSFSHILEKVVSFNLPNLPNYARKEM